MWEYRDGVCRHRSDRILDDPWLSLSKDEAGSFIGMKSNTLGKMLKQLNHIDEVSSVAAYGMSFLRQIINDLYLLFAKGCGRFFIYPKFGEYKSSHELRSIVSLDGNASLALVNRSNNQVYMNNSFGKKIKSIKNTTTKYEIIIFSQ